MALLCSARCASSREERNSLSQRLGRNFRQPAVQRTARLSRRDFDFFREQNVAGIKTLVHVHNGDPGFAITRGDRRLDWGRTAPMRQNRCVQIEARDLWNFEHFAWKNLPVGHYDNHIRIQNPYCLNRFSRLDPGRLENRQFDFRCPGRDAQLLTCCFDGRRREFLIATDGFVWLSDDTDQLMLAPFAEHSQCRHGDITRADKNDPHSR